MNFKILRKALSGIILFCFTAILFIGCVENEKGNTDNTFFIELVNFTNDSLKQNIEENMFGKVSFYKNDKLEILSMNYVTEDFPDMHFYKNVSVLDSEIKAETKKIKIEFSGDYSIDSIKYSLQKFVFRNKEWKKISDMGILKGTTTYKKAKEYAIKEFGKQIVNNAVLYSYN